MKKILIPVLLLFSSGAWSAVKNLAEQQIGDISIDAHQTNWATSDAWADGAIAHSAAVDKYGAMSFAQFDPSKGNLTQVVVTVGGSWIGELTAQNQGTAQNNTSIDSGQLTVTMAFDVFNDYTAGTFGNPSIELSGFTTLDANSNGALSTTDAFDAVALPTTLAPGETIVDDDVSGSFSGQTITYNAGDAGFVNFIGLGSWDMGCMARSDDEFDTSGGSPLTGHTAFAQCSASVAYTYEPNPATLGDKVWLDANKNGVQDSDESGVNDVTVRLYREGESTALETTTTSGGGLYLFEELDAGDYVVEFSNLPSGYQFTSKNAGSDTGADSDADASTGKTTTITLAAGDDDRTWDAGIYQPALLAQLATRSG
jgi:hypothetical protein